MNRFFDPGEYRRDVPRRAYARLDGVEPGGPQEDGVQTYLLDAVDANWTGFIEGPYALTNPELERRMRKHWRNMFSRNGDEDFRLYDEVPIYRLEITLEPGDRMIDDLPETEADWVVLRLNEDQEGTPVDVFGGLFAPEPLTGYLTEPPHRASEPESRALNRMFSMDDWPDTDTAEIEDVLKQNASNMRVEYLACLDIGQGLASALCNVGGCPVYFFDTGRGCFRNAKTAPAVFDMCTWQDPPVILSHWDTDHWASAKQASPKRVDALRTLDWIAPRQKIGPSHAAFADSILGDGGTIRIVADGAPPIRWSGLDQSFDLRRGTGSDRNSSGLVLIVQDDLSGNCWVLNGDTGYDFIPHPHPQNIVAMIAPHHGADMKAASIPFAKPSTGDAKLIYSFGPNNAHGSRTPPVRHPVAAAVSSHEAQGWDHGLWTTNPPGKDVAGGDVLATAQHDTTHLDHVIVDWWGAAQPPTIFCTIPI